MTALTLEKANIVLIAPEKDSKTGLADMINKRFPDILNVQPLPFSHLTPEDVPDAVVTLDSLEVEGEIIVGVPNIINAIRERVGKLVPVVVLVFHKNTDPHIEESGEEHALMVHQSEAIPQALRMVLGLEQ